MKIVRIASLTSFTFNFQFPLERLNSTAIQLLTMKRNHRNDACKNLQKKRIKEGGTQKCTDLLEKVSK